MIEHITCFMVEKRGGQYHDLTGDAVLCDTVYLLPPGAMWWRNHAGLPASDDPDPRPMPHLAVMTPAGVWCIDDPSSDDRTYWSRTGTPPRVTAAPSVNVSEGEWHGWLKRGVLIRCDD